MALSTSAFNRGTPCPGVPPMTTSATRSGFCGRTSRSRPPPSSRSRSASARTPRSSACSTSRSGRSPFRRPITRLDRRRAERRERRLPVHVLGRGARAICSGARRRSPTSSASCRASAASRSMARPRSSSSRRSATTTSRASASRPQAGALFTEAVRITGGDRARLLVLDETLRRRPGRHRPTRARQRACPRSSPASCRGRFRAPFSAVELDGYVTLDDLGVVDPDVNRWLYHNRKARPHRGVRPPEARRAASNDAGLEMNGLLDGSGAEHPGVGCRRAAHASCPSRWRDRCRCAP